jgi:hypothetical protein
MDLPKFCACGEEIKYSNESRCESCFVEDTVRYHGRAQRVKSYAYLEGDHHGHQGRGCDRV